MDNKEIKEKKIFEYSYGCVPKDYTIKCPLCGAELSVSQFKGSRCECGFKTYYNAVAIPYSSYEKGIKEKLYQSLGRFITLSVKYDNVYFLESNDELYFEDISIFKDRISISEYKAIKSECNDLSKRLKQAKLIYDLYQKACRDDAGNPLTLFYNFCDANFKICTTTVKNLIGIHKRFVIDMELENYIGYTYSQLVEILAIDYDDLKGINPSMSVRSIREYKAKLARLEKDDSQTSDRKEKERPSEKYDNEYDDYEREVQDYIRDDNRLTPIKVISVAEELKDKLLSECKYKESSSSYKAYELACNDFINELTTAVNGDIEENAENMV